MIDRLSNMAARGHKSLWLAEIFNDLLLRYYMEDGIENCHEWSLQAANQVLTTIDQNLVRNISAKYGSNPSNGSWEEVCFTYFP
jgi:hypothetical protein